MVILLLITAAVAAVTATLTDSALGHPSEWKLYLTATGRQQRHQQTNLWAGFFQSRSRLNAPRH